jgi:hypothetical protein
MALILLHQSGAKVLEDYARFDSSREKSNALWSVFLFNTKIHFT